MILIQTGAERIYPGSHELQPLALFRLGSPLLPEGHVAVASLQRVQGLPGPEAGDNLPQTLELLSELADAISRHVTETRRALANNGYRSSPTPPAEFPSLPE